MCLFKIHEEEEVRVPRRVVVRTTRTRSPSPRRVSHHSVQRVSREVVREHRPSASFVAVPAPQSLPIPAPQPVPVFVEPPPTIIPPRAPSVSAHSHHGHHYVEVSPRSSVSSHSPSRAAESVVYEREYRRERERARDYSPESSPRYETFRYVEGAPPSESDRYERFTRRERSRSRARSRGREYEEYDPRGSYRETTTRIVIDEDGRRRREYRH